MHMLSRLLNCTSRRHRFPNIRACSNIYFGTLFHPFSTELSEASSSSTTTSSSEDPQHKQTTESQLRNKVQKDWSSQSARRAFFDRLGRQLKIENFSDWYKVTVTIVTKAGGGGLLGRFEGSLHRALQDAYPHVNLDPTQFSHVPKNYWNNPAHRRQFLESVAKQLHYVKMEDWYKATTTSILQFSGASRVLKYHNNSFSDALQDLFPEFNWDKAKLSRRPRRYWYDLGNQKQQLEYVAKKLGISDPLEWTQVTGTQLQGCGAGSMLKLYSNSVFNMLKTVYPEVDWDIHKFKTVPRSVVQDAQKLVSLLEQKLYIKKPEEEWYRVSQAQIATVVKPSLVERLGGLANMLSVVYPHVTWIPEKFSFHGKKAQQRWLRVAVQQLFPPSTIIIEDYHHPQLLFEDSKEPMELDIYVEQFKIAFEYHGKQHFEDIRFFGSYREYQLRDEEKREACNKANITLIEVPYTWNSRTESIAAIIRSVRPDIPLLQDTGKSSPPTGAIQLPSKTKLPSAIDKRDTPTISFAVPAPSHTEALMHATVWNLKNDPSGWWMSEKYDGVRCYWDGQTLRSRHGKPLDHTPQFFREGLPPKVPLDGELWVERGRVPETSLLFRSAHVKDWEQVRYCVFDIPNQQMPLEQRLAVLDSIPLPPQVIRVQHIKCSSPSHLFSFYENISINKGEGVVLRAPHSLYRPGRSPFMCKWKTFRDTEVKMVQRHQSASALYCEQLDGQVILVNCMGQTWSEPPKPGTILTVRYNGVYKSGKLRQPHLLRVRNDDATWEQLKANNWNAKEEQPQAP